VYLLLFVTEALLEQIWLIKANCQRLYDNFKCGGLLMAFCYVLSYQRAWLYVYVLLEPQFVVKRVTIEYVLLYHICGCLVPGK
jgi:hypothetical protein